MLVRWKQRSTLACPFCGECDANHVWAAILTKIEDWTLDSTADPEIALQS